MAEVGGSLGIAVLGAVLNARFAALAPVAVAGVGSFPAALAAAGDAENATGSSTPSTTALVTGETVGAVAVLAGGLLAAGLLRRARRSEPARLPDRQSVTV